MRTKENILIVIAIWEKDPFLYSLTKLKLKILRYGAKKWSAYERETAAKPLRDIYTTMDICQTVINFMQN